MHDSLEVTTCSSNSTVAETTPATQVNMQGFEECTYELEERNDLESKLFSYMFAKHVIPHRLTLTDFKTLYAKAKCTQHMACNLYYMEILDENPDSAETMRIVANMLFKQANSRYQNGYVVLVGDGKTYSYLMHIKLLYGTELAKLLIFPGDWHTLANFQPVIMKIYYDVGLKELAIASGYRGETLTSLKRSSNFKRTHAFLCKYGKHSIET